MRSTHIYCRPSCPARRPLRRNVSFFRTGVDPYGRNIDPENMPWSDLAKAYKDDELRIQLGDFLTLNPPKEWNDDEVMLFRRVRD